MIEKDIYYVCCNTCEYEDICKNAYLALKPGTDECGIGYVFLLKEELREVSKENECSYFRKSKF